MRADKAKVNQMLMQNGLGALDDPGLIPQLGFLMGTACKEHSQFRELLNKCQPGRRRDMYEAMKPYLKFEVKPLDVYVAELGQIADVKQLPVVAPDGTLKPYRVAEVDTTIEPSKEKKAELSIAQQAIVAAVAKGTLTMLCKRCTREESFPGTDRLLSLHQARALGWTYSESDAKEVCPKCAQ